MTVIVEKQAFMSTLLKATTNFWRKKEEILISKSITVVEFLTIQPPPSPWPLALAAIVIVPENIDLKLHF